MRIVGIQGLLNNQRSITCGKRLLAVAGRWIEKTPRRVPHYRTTPAKRCGFPHIPKQSAAECGLRPNRQSLASVWMNSLVEEAPGTA